MRAIPWACWWTMTIIEGGGDRYKNIWDGVRVHFGRDTIFKGICCVSFVACSNLNIIYPLFYFGKMRRLPRAALRLYPPSASSTMNSFCNAFISVYPKSCALCNQKTVKPCSSGARKPMLLRVQRSLQLLWRYSLPSAARLFVYLSTGNCTG